MRIVTRVLDVAPVRLSSGDRVGKRKVGLGQCAEDTRAGNEPLSSENGTQWHTRSGRSRDACAAQSAAVARREHPVVAVVVRCCTRALRSQGSAAKPKVYGCHSGVRQLSLPDCRMDRLRRLVTRLMLRVGLCGTRAGGGGKRHVNDQFRADVRFLRPSIMLPDDAPGVG